MVYPSHIYPLRFWVELRYLVPRRHILLGQDDRDISRHLRGNEIIEARAAKGATARQTLYRAELIIKILSLSWLVQTGD